jgi:hypothetical protein
LRRIIRAPADKGDLVTRALSGVQVVLDIEDGIATADALLASPVLALCVQQLVAEGVVIRVLGGLLDDDLFPVITDLVNDPFDVLAELELVERANALWRYGNTETRWLALCCETLREVLRVQDGGGLLELGELPYVRTRIEPAVKTVNRCNNLTVFEWSYHGSCVDEIDVKERTSSALSVLSSVACQLWGQGGAVGLGRNATWARHHHLQQYQG